MLDAKKLAEIISYSFISHDEQAKTDKNRIRLWDKKTLQFFSSVQSQYAKQGCQSIP